MIHTFVRHRVLRKLVERKSVSRIDGDGKDGKHTYLKDNRAHKLIFVCTVCRKVSENRSTNKSQ